MTSDKTKDISAFRKAAITLDTDFAEFHRLCHQISNLDIQTDNGLDRAPATLSAFGECGERIAQGVQVLAHTLDELRKQAEKLAQGVAERALEIQERRLAREQLCKRYQSLVGAVQDVNTTMSKLKRPAGATLSEEEKAQLPQQMLEFDSQLRPLIEQARELKEDARKSNMKTLERNAGSLSQSLEAARRKLVTAFESRQ